jgi:hypothetical protein
VRREEMGCSEARVTLLRQVWSVEVARKLLTSSVRAFFIFGPQITPKVCGDYADGLDRAPCANARPRV